MKLRELEFREAPRWVPWELEFEALWRGRTHAYVSYKIVDRKWVCRDHKRRDISEGRQRAIIARIPPAILARCVTASLAGTEAWP